MTSDHVAVRPIGSLPSSVQDALDAAGVALSDDAPLGVVWCPDSPLAVPLPGHDAPSFVAFVDRPEQVDAALQVGALDVLFPASPGLHERLSTIARVDARWRARFDARVADEHRTESELQSTRDLLSRLIETTPCPVMAVGPAGDILVFNPAAEAVLGYELDWAHDHLRVSDVYVETSDARRILSAIRASPRRVVHGLHTRLRTRRGDTLEVALNAAEVYGADGLPVATIGVFLDTRGEDVLNQRLATTTEQLLRVEADREAVSQSLGDVHQLNQPLNSSMLTVELLLMDDGLPKAARHRLARVYSQLERLAEKVAEMTRPTNHSFRGHRLRYPRAQPLAPKDAPWPEKS